MGGLILALPVTAICKIIFDSRKRKCLFNRWARFDEFVFLHDPLFYKAAPVNRGDVH